MCVGIERVTYHKPGLNYRVGWRQPLWESVICWRAMEGTMATIQEGQEGHTTTLTTLTPNTDTTTTTLFTHLAGLLFPWQGTPTTGAHNAAS